ncbi:MAG: ABC-type transport auxiliary lipoprotein family protein [bacterium]|nr:ABC-type transport auxiliary lipoprotein family protein [bacterium]
MNKRLLLSGNLTVLALTLAGCMSLTSVTPPVVTRFQLDADTDAHGPTNRLRVAVQRCDGSAAYKREQIVVSPAPYVMDSYPNARWSEDPCDMLTEALMTYLGRRCAYVTTTPRMYKDDVQVIVTTYIDAFDQVQRGKQWVAVFRVKYELVADANKRVLESNRFERTRALPNGKPGEYVAAQNASANEFFEYLAHRLSVLTPPR